MGQDQRATRLGVDLGELPAEPEALWEATHVAHIACGGHAGDAASMAEALRRCARHGVAAGAHPSWPDRAGFGRRHMTMAPGALAAEVEAQCRALATVAAGLGVPIGHVKPHGALYHDADADPALAEAVVAGAVRALGDVAIVGPSGGALEAASRRFWREGFADRGVGSDGRLVPRGQPGALITEPALAAARARALVGTVDLLCVHADTPGAVQIARAVRAALETR